jgi:hypothetical protein
MHSNLHEFRYAVSFRLMWKNNNVGVFSCLIKWIFNPITINIYVHMSGITFGLLINSQIGCLDIKRNHSI